MISIKYQILFALISIACAIEMPTYEVLSRVGDMEVRKYPSTKWVGTSIRGQLKDTVDNKMFMSLFSYISGNNDLF